MVMGIFQKKKYFKVWKCEFFKNFSHPSSKTALKQIEKKSIIFLKTSFPMASVKKKFTDNLIFFETSVNKKEERRTEIDLLPFGRNYFFFGRKQNTETFQNCHDFSSFFSNSSLSGKTGYKKLHIHTFREYGKGDLLCFSTLSKKKNFPEIFFWNKIFSIKKNILFYHNFSFPNFYFSPENFWKIFQRNGDQIFSPFVLSDSQGIRSTLILNKRTLIRLNKGPEFKYNTRIL